MNNNISKLGRAFVRVPDVLATGHGHWRNGGEGRLPKGALSSRKKAEE